jgi:hypothetical protein
LKATTILLTGLALVLLSAASLQAQTRALDPDERKVLLVVLDQVNEITGDVELSSKLVTAADAQTLLLKHESSTFDGLDGDDYCLIFSRIANKLALLTIGDSLALKDLNRLSLYGIDGLAYLCEGLGKDQKSVLKTIQEDGLRSHEAARLIADGIIRKHHAILEKAKKLKLKSTGID